jgi:hypothetical protein
MRTMSGRITVVQESRFRLLGDDGITRHFILAHDANLEPQDLGPLQQVQARVRVRCTEPQGILAILAHEVAVDDRSAARLGPGLSLEGAAR